MASMRDIKRRKESIQALLRLRKAMKLVSTVKLQKAKSRAEESKPYFNKMYDTVEVHWVILPNLTTVRYFGIRERDRVKCKRGVVLFVKSGIGGRYNANLVKLVTKGDF